LRIKHNRISHSVFTNCKLIKRLSTSAKRGPEKFMYLFLVGLCLNDHINNAISFGIIVFIVSTIN
jgi:hypothetical protein